MEEIKLFFLSTNQTWTLEPFATGSSEQTVIVLESKYFNEYFLCVSLPQCVSNFLLLYLFIMVPEHSH